MVIVPSPMLLDTIGLSYNEADTNEAAGASQQLATFSPCIWHGEFLVIEAA